MSIHPEAVQKLLGAWHSIESLCHLAATGCMAKVKSKKAIDRKEVCQNVEVVKTIIEHLGA